MKVLIFGKDILTSLAIKEKAIEKLVDYPIYSKKKRVTEKFSTS